MSANATTFERSYPGREDQVGQVRHDLAPVVGGCPFAGDVVLLASELSANAVVHSRSGLPGGVFTVRAEVRPGDYAWLEVEDQGGPWIYKTPTGESGRGLALVSGLAGEGNWTVDVGRTPGSRVVWVWLDWRAEGKDRDMVAARCSCGFAELADERVTDHLHQVFEPDDLTGNDGLVHEERERLACACGLSAATPEHLDAHLLDAFTPGDAVGRDASGTWPWAAQVTELQPRRAGASIPGPVRDAAIRAGLRYRAPDPAVLKRARDALARLPDSPLGQQHSAISADRPASAYRDDKSLALDVPLPDRSTAR